MSTNCRKLYTGKKGGVYYKSKGRKVYVPGGTCVDKGSQMKRTRCVPASRVGKLKVGKLGGTYYTRKGRRVYVKTSDPVCPGRGGRFVKAGGIFA